MAGRSSYDRLAGELVILAIIVVAVLLSIRFWYIGVPIAAALIWLLVWRRAKVRARK